MLLSVCVSEKYSVLSSKRRLTIVIYPATYSGNTQLGLELSCRPIRGFSPFPSCQSLHANGKESTVRDPALLTLALQFSSFWSCRAEPSDVKYFHIDHERLFKIPFTHTHTHTHTHKHISILGTRYNGSHYLRAHFSPTVHSASRTPRCSHLADVLYSTSHRRQPWYDVLQIILPIPLLVEG